ncbi:hypothetical protein [Actinophytocola oryzae]|uniref:Uncharacterized protein n=1 Tax=Actinophytocola oryzae TaxID=502181 RepID=A0A4R7VRD0_9PSEU|nr:hypothetical protein [Actinophytocola oryzae]TDV52015.1 hypothetical protein CLV71_105146 [Actinophytocola oryzae]
MTAFLDHGGRHALHQQVPDLGALAPICGEHEFAAIVARMVADEAPRLFAVVQEYGERVDAVIAAWGMAFDDHSEIVTHQRRLSVRAPENALRMFTVGDHIRARLVWFDPDAATPVGDEFPR